MAERQEEDIDYENETTTTARRTEAEGHYDCLDLQKIDDTVYEVLQTKKEKDVRRCSRVNGVCLGLGLLCLLLLGGNIGQAVHYHALEQENTQLRSKAIDKSCPCEWKKFGDSCYYKSTEQKNREESRAQCLKTGADLVVISSQEEQDFINGLTEWIDTITMASPWIGLKRSGGKWTWVDGTPLTTTQYWATGYPANNEYKNCVAYSRNLGWFNALCSYRRYYICEK